VPENLKGDLGVDRRIILKYIYIICEVADWIHLAYDRV
jgi:hypothetical protein